MKIPTPCTLEKDEAGIYETFEGVDPALQTSLDNGFELSPGVKIITAPDAAPETGPSVTGDVVQANPVVTEEPTETRLPLRKRMRKDKRVQAALKQAQSSQGEYLARLRELEPIIYPEVAVAALKETIAKATDPAVIAEAEESLARMHGPARALARERAIHLAHCAAGPFLKTIVALCDAGEKALADLVKEAHRAETAFFGQFDLPHEQTSVSRRLATIRADIEHFHESAKGFHSSLNPVTPTNTLMGHVLVYFERESGW